MIEALQKYAKAEIHTECRLQPFENLPSQARLAEKLEHMKESKISFTEAKRIYGEVVAIPLNRKMQDVEMQNLLAR